VPVPPSGVGGQTGLAPESVYGTDVPATRFLGVTEAPFKRNPDRVQGGGLFAGALFDKSGRYVETAHHVEGSTKAPVTAKGWGMVFRQAFGSAATPTQQSASAAYLQTHTIADLLGISASWQVGVPDLTGTSRPYTMLGGKVTAIEFTQEAKGLLTTEVTLLGQDLVETVTIASPTYTDAQEPPFHHAQWAFTAGVAGSEAAVVGVSKYSIKIERKQKTDRDYANSAGLIAEPVTNDMVAITGSITADFVDKTVFADRFSGVTGFSIINTWTGAIIASSFHKQLAIATPSCFLTGDTPTLDGPDVVSGDFPFEVKDDGTHTPFSLTYMSTDTVL
jgi:hypothetical protein